MKTNVTWDKIFDLRYFKNSTFENLYIKLNVFCKILILVKNLNQSCT